jgi:NAD(P)-dependent dehydrogenase (short-subunit alcohol dehydrogenase family)
MARSAGSATPVELAIKADGGRARVFEADATRAASVSAAFAAVRKELGSPQVFIYNAGAFRPGGVLDVEPDEFDKCWRANCFGAFVGAREVLPAMVEKRQGTILLTGATASLRGSARFSCLAVGKFGLRALSQSLAREFGASGIHVAHVVIDGQIDTPRMRAMAPGRSPETLLSPDAIAETYWQLHVQHPSAWSLEVDVRPSLEKF